MYLRILVICLFAVSVQALTDLNKQPEIQDADWFNGRIIRDVTTTTPTPCSSGTAIIEWDSCEIIDYSERTGRILRSTKKRRFRFNWPRWLKPWTWFRGDPHYQTFDGKSFDFQGTCSYVLAQTIDDSLEPFRMTSSNMHVSPSLVGIKEITIEVYSSRITLYTDNTFTVDGKPYSVGQRFNVSEDGSKWFGVIPAAGGEPIFLTEFGIQLAVDLESSMTVMLPDVYEGKIQGLLGNLNYDQSDDFTMPDGGITADPVEFGNSWKAAESEPQCDDGTSPVSPCVTEEQRLVAEDLCSDLADPQGVFAPCHADLDPATFTEACVHDMCAEPGRTDHVCDVIMQYSAICQSGSGDIINWQSANLTVSCDTPCDPNAEYATASYCPGVCGGMWSKCADSMELYSGCVCKEGMAFSGGRCVPFDQCGCSDSNGIYRAGGETWDEGCTHQCHCDVTTHNVTCDVSPCPGYMSCNDDVCLCDNDQCRQSCQVEGDGMLSSPTRSAYQLTGRAKHTVAEKGDHSSRDPCKARVRVVVDELGDVEWAAISYGQHPGRDEKYHSNIAFEFKGDPIVIIRGSQVSSPKLQEITAPYSADSGAYYVELEGDFTSGWTLRGWCHGYQSFTMYYRVPGHPRLDLHVPDPKDWRGTCYV